MADYEALRVPAAHRALCQLCGEPLDTRSKTIYRWSAGWALQRAKGTNALACAEHHRMWAHGECVRLAARGHLEQGTLF